MKHIKHIREHLNESAASEKLAAKIDRAIAEVDDSLDYRELAKAVAKVLADGYGSHLYEQFLAELRKALK